MMLRGGRKTKRTEDGKMYGYGDILIAKIVKSNYRLTVTLTTVKIRTEEILVGSRSLE